MVAQSLCLLLWCSSSAQFASIPSIGAAPFGLRGVLPSGDESGTAIEEVWDGLDVGIGMTALYDSNFFLSEKNPQNELVMHILPQIRYSSASDGGVPFSLTASYQPMIRSYLNNPDLDGVDHSGGISMQVCGAKTVLMAYMNYSSVSQTDRFTGSFVNGSLLDGGVRGTYQIAPRTSLYAIWGLSLSDYDSELLVGSESHTAEIGGFWSATELLSFGPSIRYMKQESDNTGTRESWALSLQARALMGARWQVQGTLGLQCAKNSRDGGATSLDPTGGLSASYAINERMAWKTSLTYSTISSPTEVNYIMNNLSLSTGLTRQLLRGSVSTGVEMNQSDYVKVGTTNTNPGSQDNLSVFLSYSRKCCVDRLDFNSTIRYVMNDGQRDWSQIQLSAGIHWIF